MITTGAKMHYIAVKSFSMLLGGITSNHDGDYHSLNCLYSFETKMKLKSHENICKDHNYCHYHMIMSEKSRIIMKYRSRQRIFEDSICFLCGSELLLEKINAGKTIQNNISQQKEENVQRVAIHYSHPVHSIAAAENTIFTEMLTK